MVDRFAVRWIICTCFALWSAARHWPDLGCHPWAVFTRYFSIAPPSWPEPLAVLLSDRGDFIGPPPDIA